MPRSGQTDFERLLTGLLRFLLQLRGGRAILVWGGLLLGIVAYIWFRPALERTLGIELPGLTRQEPPPGSRSASGAPVAAGEEEILRAFTRRQSDVIVRCSATVKKLLPDDDVEPRHQKMLLRLSNGHSLLLAHNIDLAERVPVQVGDRIEFQGEYEYSEPGGVIHWTHRDPAGRHAPGWIEFQGRRFD